MSEELPDVMTGLEEYYGWLEKAKKVWELTRPIIRALSKLGDIGYNQTKKICGDKILIYGAKVYLSKLGDCEAPHGLGADLVE